MQKKSFKKIILGAFIITLLFGAKAHAQLVVSDPGATAAIGVANGFLGDSASSDDTSLGDKIALNAADAAAYAAAQILARQITALIVNAANGGASGHDHPQQFIQDFNLFYQNISNNEISVLSKQLLADNANPFAAAAAVSLTTSAAATGVGNLNSTIDKIPGVDYQAASTDIGAAGAQGWDFYSQLALPQNTPLGTEMMAQEMLADNINYANKVQTTKISTSGYIPSQAPCNVNYQTEGDLQDAVNQAEANLQAATVAGGGVPTQAQQNAINAAQAQVTAASQALAKANNGNADNEFATNCVQSAITNPKGTIDSLVNQAAIAPIQGMASSDKWYKLLATTFANLATQLINVGITKLQSALTSYTSGGPAASAPAGYKTVSQCSATSSASGITGSFISSPGCGSSSGQTVAILTATSPTLCSAGTSVSNFSTTATGWSWICQ